jgi:hypothetical protein
MACGLAARNRCWRQGLSCTPEPEPLKGATHATIKRMRMKLYGPAVALFVLVCGNRNRRSERSLVGAGWGKSARKFMRQGTLRNNSEHQVTN